jgi:hypothetical protein
MDDSFEFPQCGRIGKNHSPKLASIYSAPDNHTRKSRIDFRDRTPSVSKQTMDCGIGIMKRKSEPVEHFTGCRFAHADRSGQSEDGHGGKTPRPACAASQEAVFP